MLRVLIADLPDLQADIVADLVAAEADMVVVGRCVPPFALPGPLEALAPDVVLVTAPLAEQNSVLLRLEDHPNTTVLALHHATGTVVQLHGVPAGDDWPSELIAAIRVVGKRHDA